MRILAARMLEALASGLISASSAGNRVAQRLLAMAAGLRSP